MLYYILYPRNKVSWRKHVSKQVIRENTFIGLYHMEKKKSIVTQTHAVQTRVVQGSTVFDYIPSAFGAVKKSWPFW